MIEKSGKEGEKVVSRAIFKNQLNKLVESKIYNHGLDRLRQFGFQGNIYQSLPIKVHDRRVFLSNIMESGIRNFSIMDVVNLRQADMATDGIRGNKGADFLLNDLSHVVVDYLNRFNSENKGKKITFCRYGGDEFAFSYSGLVADEIKRVNSEIQSLINNQVRGFFKPNLIGEKIIKRKVEVEFKLINKPEDVLEQEIFNHFIKNGVMLKIEEINKLKKMFGEYEKFREWQDKERIPDLYSVKHKNLDDKLRYLSKLNPILEKEINKLIDLADILGESAKFQLQKELESIFIDPLLRSPFLSAADVIDNIKAGNISHIWTKDLKFLKQFNNISYADGDNAIKILWENINKTIYKEDLEKLVFARNGGTFFIGLKSGEKLSRETTKKLSDLAKISYQGILSKDAFIVNLGSFDHKVNEEFIKKKYGLSTELSDDDRIKLINLLTEENKLMFVKSDDQFYDNMAVYLLSHWDQVFSKFHTPLEGFFTTSFVHDYFISKRAIQHLIGLEKALDRLENNSMKKLRQNILKKIRIAINYSYTNNMLEESELQNLNFILVS